MIGLTRFASAILHDLQSWIVICPWVTISENLKKINWKEITLFPVRLFAAVILGASLSGCMTPQPPSGAPNSLAVVARSVPAIGDTGNIDLYALRDIYLAQNPDRFGVPLYKTRRQGFRLNPDGTTVRYGAFGASGELFVTPEILSYENGVICIGRKDGFGGGCFSASFTPEGRIEVTYDWGNGRGGSYIASDL